MAQSSGPLPMEVYEAVTQSREEAEELAYRENKARTLARAKQRWNH